MKNKNLTISLIIVLLFAALFYVLKKADEGVERNSFKGSNSIAAGKYDKLITSVEKTKFVRFLGSKRKEISNHKMSVTEQEENSFDTGIGVFESLSGSYEKNIKSNHYDKKMENSYEYSFNSMQKNTSINNQGVFNPNFTNVTSFIGTRRNTEEATPNKVYTLSNELAYNNISKPLFAFGNGSEGDEDPFDGGGGVDNGDYYNDVPVGDGIPFMLFLSAIFIGIKKIKKKI